MRKQWSDEEAANVRRRYEAMERPSTRRLAAETGWCPNTVNAMVRAAGGTLIPRGGTPREKVWTQEQAETLKTEYLADDKPNIVTLARRHGIPETRVRVMLHAANTPMRPASVKRTGSPE